MSVELVTIVLIGSLLLTIFLGAPMAFALGGTSVALAFFLIGPKSAVFVALNTFAMMTNFLLLAVPLFIFMGNLLERSGIANDLYATMQAWFGPVRGGLAMGAVVMCTIFAALTGVSAASTISVGIASLPNMLSRNYDRHLAIGAIAAGGALGILIPPSVIMIVYAVFAGQSVGRLFAGGIVPGLILSASFITYIAIRCGLQPHLGPALPQDQRFSWSEKLVSLGGVIFPVLLVVMMLGAIFAGLATPTEAAAVGALGALLFTAAKGKLTWKVATETCQRTLRLTCMALWITIAAVTFSAIYSAVGASQLITDLLTATPGGRWGVLVIMMLTFFVLGMLMDPMGILLLTMPIFAPVAQALGFDLVWFGVLFVINMEMAYLTPPFGFNLFYLRGIAPDWVTMGDIYRSVIPFIGLQALVLVLAMLFEDTILWLPRVIFGS